MAVITYTKTGSKATTSAKLAKSIFGLENVNRRLLKQAYVTYLANGRQNLAVTKTRGLVRGGGIKPWRQKGTGRARVGSRRTPVWRGGGIVFGPTGLENYHLNMNLKTKRLALCQALTSANNEGRIRVIEALKFSTPKTALARKLLGKLDLTGYTLIIDSKPELNSKKALNNLPEVKLVDVSYVNVARIMDADTLLITNSGLEVLENWLGGERK